MNKNKWTATDVSTTDMADMMKPSTLRTMPMKGFDDHFVDIADYIVRITSWIWDEKKPDLCINYYSQDCPVHTLSGNVSGVERVIEGTKNTLASFPDRTLDALNVVWSGNQDTGYLSSHLIMSTMTNTGPSEFGPATHKQARFLTIADCLCVENKIIEEWLMRDTITVVRDLGYDPFEIASKQALQDIKNNDPILAAHKQEIDRIKQNPISGPIELPHRPEANPLPFAKYVLRGLWQNHSDFDLSKVYDFRAEISMPDNKRLYGKKDLADYFNDIHSMLTKPSITIDHVGDIPYMETGRDIAVRWSFTGLHTGTGRYGEPTQAPIRILGATHWRVIKGRIHREWTVFDEVAVLRQIAVARISQNGN